MYDTLAPRPDHICLFDVATPQMGYFTAAQARQCGVGWDLLSYHARTGRFRRIQHGLYRLRDFPPSMYEEVMAAWVATGKDIAVVSHESALELFDLSDNVPSAVHLTIPRAKRRTTPMYGVVLHTVTTPFLPTELAWREGMRVTSAARTIVDAAALPIDLKQVDMAVWQALRRGLTTPKELREQASRRGGLTEEFILSAMDAMTV